MRDEHSRCHDRSSDSRRLSSIPESVWRALLRQLAMPFHAMNLLKIYLADSFPVPVYRNILMLRCTIYQDECFRGRVSSRKEYFYGLKVYALMTESGITSFHLPAGSVVYGDRAYNAYNVDYDLEQSYVHLNPIRKNNSKI